MASIGVLILRGAMPSSVSLTIDTLLAANALSPPGSRPPFRIGVGGSGADQWRDVLGDSVRDGLPAKPDMLIMPGLGMNTADQIASRLAQDDAREAGDFLVRAHRKGAEIVTSCSGAFLLARAGLLAGRRATTTWWLAPVFRKLHPDVDLTMDDLIVTDGGVTTAGAALAQMDVMLTLVARLGGPALAAQCSRYLLIDERPSQSRYMAVRFLAQSDATVAKAESWARKRLGDDITVADLAAKAGLAPRTFARRVESATGLSPIHFLQRLRTEAAMALLETTRLSIDEIAHRVGYADPSALRRIMQREGLRPSALRRAASA